MREFLLQIDYGVLKFLNVGLASPFLDQFWLIVTHLERFMIGKILIAGLLALGFYIYRVSFFKVLLVVGIAVGASDLLSYRVVKHFVDRPRPFQNLEISSWLRHVGDAHGPSFPSNHAANVTAGAIVLAAYFYRGRYLFYIFALLVCLSRPALGVHYPSDVLAGSLIGFIVGLSVIEIFLWKLRPTFDLPSSDTSTPKDSAGWRARVRRLEDR